MAVVAGLFDSDADATEAMDKIMHAGIKDLETRVIEPGTYTGEGTGVGGVAPVIPNTAGSGMGMPGAVVPFGTGGGRIEWLDEMDEVDRAFYLEGLKEGANLALAHVHDEDVAQVREMFRAHGARTHVRD